MLLLNPGGPGDPAMGLAAVMKTSALGLAARFDMVGMDPRFTGRSTSLACHWTTDNAMRSAGPGRRGFAESVAFARRLAAGCVRGNEPFLPYASTRNTARDMDAVRAALGEPRISYLGWSYGSYLGAVYMQMFPRRVDRFILDSAVDPDAYGPGLTRPMGGPSEAALRTWASWAAARDEVYHLGATAAEVLTTVGRIRGAADRRPLRVGGFRVDAHVLPLLLFLPIRSDAAESYAQIAADVRVLADAAEGRPATPGPALRETLAGILAAPPEAAGRDGTFIVCADSSEHDGPRAERA